MGESLGVLLVVSAESRTGKIGRWSRKKKN
jgi:hypothetical protein